MDRPEWCFVGSIFEWKAPQITGSKMVKEKIIGYTDKGFLHTANNCPVYETLFEDLNGGIVRKNI